MFLKKLIPNNVKKRLFPYFLLARKLSGDKKNELTRRKIAKEMGIQKPRVVNMNANDICNSKCTMCNIWQQKQDFEFSPADLEKVLSNTLFQEVDHIGITGGEPTLREDLPQLYESVIKAIPGIKGLSIITNSIREKDVISRIESVIEVCKKHGKQFSMMVSLDGYGPMHDKVRGREGNFNSAFNVINHFKQLGIPLATGTTISKVNVWDVDELLDFMREKEIYGRFRVAEFINRLYNNDRMDVIRNFDEDEIYHLILFFYKLIFTFEKEHHYQQTYYSIISILSGGKRLIGCPYQERGIVLNSRAEIAYCAPKSAVIGDALKEDAMGIYSKNVEERNRIKMDHCDQCIHDYHSETIQSERVRAIYQQFYQHVVSLDNLQIIPFHGIIKAVRRNKKQVFITGWYGTETVGDKAILGGIIDEMKNRLGNDTTFIISSLHPLITERTVKELKLDAIVVPVYSREFIAYIKGSNYVVMGGGPLMDLDELALPLHAFRIGRKYGAKNIIYGCGLGPLTEAKYTNAVKIILSLADEIKLRDKKSIEMATTWLGKDDHISLSGDPAKVYLKRFVSANENKQRSKRNVIRCFLREWTYEYSKDISFEEFQVLKDSFEMALAEFIRKKAIELNADEVILEHMHNFVVGNDDRDYSRYFIRKYSSHMGGVKLSYNKYLSTVDSIVDSMATSMHNICMRFHSVVFAHTLNTSFTAIDYTKGGKILNYLKDNNEEENLLSIDSIIQKAS